jgi:putative ABC transport system substrate-binding protein
MNRREFVASLGGAVVAWPLGVRAQATNPVIGFLSSVSAASISRAMTGFRQGLKDIGFVEGQNVAIEYRWADGRDERLPLLVAELIHRDVAVIVATGGGSSAKAAKAATSTIPIVFSAAADPVQLGLVSSLSRPNGNATGVHVLATLLEGKRLGLLHELLPTVASIAILVNPNTPGADDQVREVEAAARAIAKQVSILRASNEAEIEAAFAELARVKAGGLLVAADPFLTLQRQRLVELAARGAIPAIYEFRDFPIAGGLMSYGTNLADAYRQVGAYAGRILNGEKPVDLPVVQPTRFELVINLKTAKSLGLTVPESLLARADEVIE